MDGLTEQVAMVDLQWRILAVNEGWDRLAATGNYDCLRLHGNYLDFARQRAAEGKNGAARVLSALAEFDAGERRHFRYQYAASTPWAGRIYLITIDRFESRGERFATIIRTDVTELEELRRQNRRRGSRLLRAQEDERRRIGRDLHDSTAQLLIGLQLGLARLKQSHRHRNWPRPSLISRTYWTAYSAKFGRFRSFAIPRHWSTGALGRLSSP